MPLGNSVTVPRGQRLESPLVRCDNPWFLWLDLHSQNLPEPYTSMRPKKTCKPCGILSFLMIHLHSQNLPEAYSSMRSKKTLPKPSRSLPPGWATKNRGETMWRFNFFLWVDFHSHNLPEPDTSMRPKKTRKTMWRFKLFLWVDLHNQNLPDTYTWMSEGQKREKTMWPFNPFGGLSFTAKTLQKPTPAWETNKERKTMRRFKFFVRWLSQPEPSTCLHVTEKKTKNKSMQRFKFFLNWASQPQPSRNLRLNDRPKKSGIPCGISSFCFELILSQPKPSGT